MGYHCSDCNMAVKGLTCAKCSTPLVHDEITTPEGKNIQVAKCPNNCGKIKSPQCCGHDMEVEMDAQKK